MDLQEKVREAIVAMTNTDDVFISNLNFEATKGGFKDVTVMAYVGNPRDGLQRFDMCWNPDKQRFFIDGVTYRKHNKNSSLMDRFNSEYNSLKLGLMTHERLISLLQKANKRRKLVEKKWKKKAHRYRDDFIRERDAQARTCANFRKYMDEVEAREWELKRRENEYKQWRDRVDELVNKESQRYKDLYAAQQCSCCKEKQWRRKYRETYSGMSEFIGKYIHIVDDMMRQKHLPDNVKARLCDMRIAFVESREFLDKVMKKEYNDLKD